jgi:hypothetical protein
MLKQNSSREASDLEFQALLIKRFNQRIPEHPGDFLGAFFQLDVCAIQIQISTETLRAAVRSEEAASILGPYFFSPWRLERWEDSRAKLACLWDSLRGAREGRARDGPARAAREGRDLDCRPRGTAWRDGRAGEGHLSRSAGWSSGL